MEFQKFHISVKGLIKCDKKFLLLQEDDGLWEAPGGRVDEGEMLKESLVRELGEELNLKLSEEDISNLIGIDQRYDYKLGDGWALITFFYEISLKDDFEVNLSNEHVAFVWVNKETDLSKFEFKNSNQRDIFENFKNRLS
jgi:8-oxo-dGTP pyrophosphatase MutT (NUDIX family)